MIYHPSNRNNVYTDSVYKTYSYKNVVNEVGVNRLLMLTKRGLLKLLNVTFMLRLLVTEICDLQVDTYYANLV